MNFLNPAAEKFRNCFPVKFTQMQQLLVLAFIRVWQQMAVLCLLAADFHRTHLALRNECVIYAQ